MTRLLIAVVLLCSGCAHVASSTPEQADELGRERLIQVAEAAEQAGDSLRAQQYLRVALQAGADPRKYVPRLLALYIADGQYRVAIDQGEQLLRRHPDDRATRLLLSTLYTAVGDNERAISQYERLLKAEPQHAYAHYALASLLCEQGGASLRADEHFRAYLTLEPEGEHADEARGLLLQGVP